ncbi:hypothetical protein TWF281_005620 [Arthrobotrys megalospora]
MKQPRIEPGNSITDYQNALNNVPLGVKLAHSQYEWNLAPQFSMSWQYLTGKQGEGVEVGLSDSLGLAGPNNWELVPGTKEPYYVEGPSRVTAHEWMKGPLLEYGIPNQGLGSILKSKRSVNSEPHMCTCSRDCGR